MRSRQKVFTSEDLAVGMDVEPANVTPVRLGSPLDMAAYKLLPDSGHKPDGYHFVDPFRAEAELTGVSVETAKKRLYQVALERLKYIDADGLSPEEVLQQADFDNKGLLNIPAPDFDERGNPLRTSYKAWQEAKQKLARLAEKLPRSPTTGDTGGKNLLDNTAWAQPDAAAEEIFAHLVSGGASKSQLDAFIKVAESGRIPSSSDLDAATGPARHHQGGIEIQGAAHLLAGIARRIGKAPPKDRQSALQLISDYETYLQGTGEDPYNYPDIVRDLDKIMRSSEVNPAVQNKLDNEVFWETAQLDPAVRTTRAVARGGESVPVQTVDGGGEATTEPAETPEIPQAGQESASVPSGPRVVLNPRILTKDDPRDGLCTAFNESLRVLMEVTGFEPVAEPTPAQRRFFAKTAYAGDELQLRRTILARICTLDTSIS